jgi:putative membrane protein insertion efficiency factor
VVVKLLTGLIRFYQLAISPWLPAACRYEPTCSAYAREAIETQGALHGSWLGLRRLLRCHPWGGYGYDPVPPRVTRSAVRGDAPRGEPLDMTPTHGPSGRALPSDR